MVESGAALGDVAEPGLAAARPAIVNAVATLTGQRIRRNGRLWKEDCPAALAQNDIQRATRRPGRAIWKRWSRYYVRSRVKARMRNLKSSGPRIASRASGRQTAEIERAA